MWSFDVFEVGKWGRVGFIWEVIEFIWGIIKTISGIIKTISGSVETIRGRLIGRFVGGILGGGNVSDDFWKKNKSLEVMLSIVSYHFDL